MNNYNLILKNCLSCCVVITLFIGSVHVVNAQATGTEVKPLQIGDLCPDFEFGKLINSISDKSTLSSYKGKLLIIDFWATWCGTCIDAFPNFERLQKKFGDRIAILPCTYESEEKTISFIRKNKVLKNWNRPISVENATINKYFPHVHLPHEVWVDENGVVIAITGSDEVNEQNVQHYLDKKQINLAIKKDVLNFSVQNPILFDAFISDPGPIDKNRLIANSAMLGYIDGLGGSTTAPIMNGSFCMIKGINTSIESLYQSAFGTYIGNGDLSATNGPDYLLRWPPRTIWEAKDSTRYYWYGRQSADLQKIPKQDMLFTYELVLPRKDSLKLHEYMAQDLNRYFGDRFGIEGVKERRTVKCWVLKKQGDIIGLSTKGSKKEVGLDVNSRKFKFTNMTIKEILFWWTIYLDRYPIPMIDETGYHYAIDIDLNVEPLNFDEVNKLLPKHGLEFKLETRELEMIVIRDKK